MARQLGRLGPAEKSDRALVGMLNDFVFESATAVTKSVAIVVGASAVATAGVLAAGMRPFRTSLGEP